MELEEELNQLRQLNEALREKAELLEHLNSSTQEQNRLLQETVDAEQKPAA